MPEGFRAHGSPRAAQEDRVQDPDGAGVRRDSDETREHLIFFGELDHADG